MEVHQTSMGELGNQWRNLWSNIQSRKEGKGSGPQTEDLLLEYSCMVFGEAYIKFLMKQEFVFHQENGLGSLNIPKQKEEERVMSEQKKEIRMTRRLESDTWHAFFQRLSAGATLESRRKENNWMIKVEESKERVKEIKKQEKVRKMEKEDGKKIGRKKEMQEGKKEVRKEYRERGRKESREGREGVRE